MSNNKKIEKTKILHLNNVNNKNLHINELFKKEEKENQNLYSQDTTTDSSDIINISDNKIINIRYTFFSEYFDELYRNLLLDETKNYQKININYIFQQSHINTKMRAILIDWIIEINFHCNFNQKTLFNTIYIIDAYLSKNNIETKYFQLLGLASLVISCKENEIVYPDLNTFLHMTNDAYKIYQLINMENKIIKSLNYDFLTPTSDEFFDLFAEYYYFTDKQIFSGNYFLEASLLDSNLIKYKPSTIGIACCYIVMKYFNLIGINSLLNNTIINTIQKDVKNCASELYILVKNLSKSSLKAIKEKYMSHKFLKVAELCEEWIYS